MHFKAQGENISQLLILGHSNVQLSMCYFFFKRFKNIFFFFFLFFFLSNTLHSCLFSSESDSDSYSDHDTSAWRGQVWSECCCCFFSEIESTHRKYNEVSWTPCYQEHTTVVSKTNYSKPFSFCAFFSPHTLPICQFPCDVCLTTA